MCIRDRAPVELLGKFDDAAHGGQQRGHVHHVGHQVAGLDAARPHEKAARHQHHQIDQAVKQAGSGVECAHPVVGLPLDVQKTGVVLLEFLFFHLFAGKGLYHPFAQQRVLDAGVQFADLAALLLKHILHPVVEKGAAHRHHRDQRKDDTRQKQIGPGQDHKGDGHLQSGDEKLLGAVVLSLIHI